MFNIFRRKKLLLALAVVTVLTLGIVGTAFAAGPNGHGTDHQLPAVAQSHSHGHSNSQSNSTSTSASQPDHATGAARATEQVKAAFERHISHMEQVMSKVPSQAKDSIQSVINRLQSRLQSVLNDIGK